MPRIVCVPCEKFYRPEKIGVVFEEGRPLSRVGKPAVWTSYKLWNSDMLKCPGCKHRLLAGIPMFPFAEHYQPDYESTKVITKPIFRVDDYGG